VSDLVVQEQIIDRLIRDGYVDNVEDGAELFDYLLENLKLNYAFDFPSADELWRKFDENNLL